MITILRNKSDLIVCVLAIAVIILLPIYRGGNAEEAVALLLIATASILILCSKDLASTENSSWLLVAGCFTLCVFLQAYAASALSINGIGLKANVFSLDLLYIWALFIAFLTLSFVVSQLSFESLPWLMVALFLASLFQAVFGIYHFASDSESVLGLWNKRYYLKDATGTFVNRNHYAGMMAMSWPIVCSALLSKRPALLVRAKRGLRMLVAVVYSIILLAALLSSHSRMGLFAALFGFAVFISLFLRELRRESRYGLGKVKYFPVLASILLLMFSIWFGVEDIAKRFTTLENGDSRLAIWQAMFDLPLSSWLLGIGPGSFELVFHLVQPSYLTVRFVEAHNDYLEFFIEFGLVFGAIIVLSFVNLLRISMPRGGMGARAGAIGALTAVALHSVVDFNLQVPGSALIAWIALGLLMNKELATSPVVNSSQDRVVNKRRQSGGRRHRLTRTGKRGRLPKTKQEWLAFFRSD